MEDKQVLIDNTDLEDLSADKIIPSSDFATEYENCGERVTFQPCSDPIETSSFNSRIFCTLLWRRLQRVTRPFQVIKRVIKLHGKLFISSLLVICSCSGSLIFFPLHLENVSNSGGSVGDGYSACLCASTITTILLLFNCILLEVLGWGRSSSVLKPMVDWRGMIKVGFCLGLSLVTIFYSWEDDKVPCNFQDPLLGLVIIFAIITHAVCKWRRIGLKRTFSLSAVAAGVFLSVDYPLVDHHRCRGSYYRAHTMEGGWSWKVNLVWTLAFVVSIWLATVAAFFLESSIPVPKVKHSRLYDLEYNAVKLRVMQPPGTEFPSEGPTTSPSKSYRFNPYAQFHVSLIANAVLWFSVVTWFIILSLFWTLFIPGFGKGISVEMLPDRLLSAFRTSLTTPSSWGLFASLFLFSNSFTYLVVLMRSPIAAISVATVAFPIIGLWWSFFQIQYSLFVWMPVFSGELICAFLGLITVSTGAYFFIKFEILKPAKVHKPQDLYAQHY